MTRPEQQGRPIFVLGSQRSGTNMLFEHFQNRSDTDPYNEDDQAAFENFLLHPFDQIHHLLQHAKAPVVAFKPICDSHRFAEFVEAFPDGSFIWLTRYYKDVANSAIRNFQFSDRAIRKVCTGQTGGGWFQEGVSAESEAILREVYDPELSRFELACLVWWARNRVVLEQNVDQAPRTLMLAYEKLVTEPAEVFSFMCEVLGLSPQPQAHRHVHSRSIKRHTYDPVAPRIEALCDELTAEIERRTRANQELRTVGLSRS